MASKADVKKAILAVAGDPESGVVFDLADKMAEAIVGLDAPSPTKESASFERPAKETRISKPEEKR